MLMTFRRAYLLDLEGRGGGGGVTVHNLSPLAAIKGSKSVKSTSGGWSSPSVEDPDAMRGHSGGD